ALQETEMPVGLVLTRQKVPNLDRGRYSPASGLRKGAYVLSETGGGKKPQAILIATGSEVSLALKAQEQLDKEGIATRVVSMPCWELFDRQPRSYQEEVLPPSVTARVAIEAGVSLGWQTWVGSG